MNISFIALNIGGSEPAQAAADVLRGVLSARGRCDFRLCSSMSQVSAALGSAFSDSEIIVVGLEPSAYCKSKLAILKAMHIKTAVNAELQAIVAQSSLSEDEQVDHCTVPASAKVFPTENGLYSGFAIKSGKQFFIMLPLDKPMLTALLEKDAGRFLDEVAPANEERTEINPDIDFVNMAVQALRENGKKVYFAATPSVEMVKTLCADGVESGEIAFSTYTAKRGSEAPRSYVADLARYAIPENEDALGAAVSNVFTGTSQETGVQKYNVYVAVADRVASRVLRFASQPGETPEELITAAIEMLMEMICDKCSPNGDAHDDEQQIDDDENYEYEEAVEEPQPEEKAKNKKRAMRTAVYAFIAIVLAAIVYFGFIGFKNASDNRGDAKSAYSDYNESFGEDFYS